MMNLKNQVCLNLREILEKYCFHDFCLCPVRKNSEEKITLKEISKPAVEERKQGVFTFKNPFKTQRKSLEFLSNTESSSPSVIKDPEILFQSIKEEKAEKKSKKLVDLAEKRRRKRIERDFTNSHARKDVVYKAILRFLKRSLETQFRMSEQHLKYKRNHSKKQAIRIEEVKSFLSSYTNQEPSEELASVFMALIDTNTRYSALSRNYEEFRGTISQVISKFNSKCLAKCFRKKEFALIFLKFWEKEESWGELMQSVRKSRVDLTLEKAYAYYLEKLKGMCREVIG